MYVMITVCPCGQVPGGGPAAVRAVPTADAAAVALAARGVAGAGRAAAGRARAALHASLLLASRAHLSDAQPRVCAIDYITQSTVSMSYC